VGRILGGYSVNTIWTYNSGQPYTPFQGSKANPNIPLQAAPTATNPNPVLPPGGIPYVNQGRALFSFCDFNYNTNSITQDSCRPILSNPTAPIGSIGINTGVGYKDFSTGAAIDPNAVHWLVNNEYEALARGTPTPYPGVGRNILRGNTVNQLDASVFKTVRINERFSGQLRLNVFNLPNRAYYGAPDAALNNANPTVHSAVVGGYSSFNNFKANPGTLVTAPFGKGTRNIQLGAKIIF
jgi:hypothetical protein